MRGGAIERSSPFPLDDVVFRSRAAVAACCGSDDVGGAWFPRGSHEGSGNAGRGSSRHDRLAQPHHVRRVRPVHSGADRAAAAQQSVAAAGAGVAGERAGRTHTGFSSAGWTRSDGTAVPVRSCAVAWRRLHARHLESRVHAVERASAGPAGSVRGHRTCRGRRCRNAGDDIRVRSGPDGDRKRVRSDTFGCVADPHHCRARRMADDNDDGRQLSLAGNVHACA